MEQRMLTIIIQGAEVFDESTSTFSNLDDTKVEFEHSLLSLSKWESKHQKPFLSSTEKSGEEIFGYIEAMVITPNLDLDVLYRLSKENIAEIQEYIDSKESATTFGHMPERRGPGEVITSELIYYWMVSFNIPFECETWHLNRLFSLIRICNIKNSKPQKMSRSELAQRNAAINAERKKKLGTSG
jgi:hypothetical protein